MFKWDRKYYNNFLENFILKTLHKEHKDDFSELCVLDTTVETNWVDFYLDTVQVAVVTSIGNHVPMHWKYTNHTNYDFLDTDLTEKLGPFVGQYDVIHVLDTFSLILSDSEWQTVIENLCTYLNKNGILIIAGDLQSTYIDGIHKNRSSGLWRAIINNCGCKVKSFIRDPIKDVVNKPCDILIVGKR